jgi:hypothetical protein
VLDVKVVRFQTAIAHTGVILWQVYSAATAWRSGLALESLLHGMGATVGPGVTLFLATCRYWLVVPIVFSILSIVAIRRIESKPMFAVTVLAAEVIVALVLNIWWREAWFGPIFSLIRQVG